MLRSIFLHFVFYKGMTQKQLATHLFNLVSNELLMQLSEKSNDLKLKQLRRVKKDNKKKGREEKEKSNKEEEKEEKSNKKEDMKKEEMNCNSNKHFYKWKRTSEGASWSGLLSIPQKMRGPCFILHSESHSHNSKQKS